MKNKIFTYRFLPFILLLLFSITSFSQSKKEIEAKRKALKKEIKLINKLLTKTNKKEKNLLTQLEDINKKIEIRNEIIHSIANESKVYSKEIKANNNEIAIIEKELITLKKAYAKMVVQRYKSKNKNSKLLFLLSSDNFLQAYKRLQYMKQYNAFHKNKALEITENKTRLLTLNDSITIKKIAKDSLAVAHIKERKTVDNEQAKQQKLVKAIKKKKSKYRKQIRKKQRQEAQYAKQLANLISGIIKKSNKKLGAKTKQFILTAEAKKLSASFVSNKGKLPAPVEKGYVSRYFGKRKHEIEKKLDVKSIGWFYTTEKNTKARAVFKGTVLGIMVDKNTKLKTVLLQHGTYVTTYRNLEKILVTKGDKVKTKQKLGTIHTNKTSGKTILGFGLWKNAKPQNPSRWIYRR